MTSTTTYELGRSLEKGITFEFDPPCSDREFSHDILKDLFVNKLPKYLATLSTQWEETSNEQISGLAPTWSGGPIDPCIEDGAWSMEKHRQHVGHIPILGGLPGSKGRGKIATHQSIMD